MDLAPAGLARLDPARLDAAVEEGRARGFEAGLHAGRAAAAEEQADITLAHRGRVDQVVEAMRAALHDAIVGVDVVAEETARATAAAAFAIAEAIVGRELALSRSPGQDAVARALALAPEADEVVVRLHPADAEHLLVDGAPTWDGVRLLADPNIARGDCVAQVGWTRIDARVDAALDRVRAVLEGTA